MAIQYNSNYGGTLPFSDVCKQISLATSTVQTWTIPGVSTQQYQALFGYASDSNIFVCLNGTAVVPGTGSQTSTQYSEFKPEIRYVKGGDILSFISPDSGATYLGISLRQLQS